MPSQARHTGKEFIRESCFATAFWMKMGLESVKQGPRNSKLVKRFYVGGAIQGKRGKSTKRMKHKCSDAAVSAGGGILEFNVPKQPQNYFSSEFKS